MLAALHDLMVSILSPLFIKQKVSTLSGTHEYPKYLNSLNRVKTMQNQTSLERLDQILATRKPITNTEIRRLKQMRELLIKTYKK